MGSWSGVQLSILPATVEPHKWGRESFLSNQRSPLLQLLTKKDSRPLSDKKPRQVAVLNKQLQCT
jgi:hypothetical protein